MALSIKIVVGNPSAASRTRQVAEKLVRALIAPGEGEIDVIELAEFTSDLFDFTSERVGLLNEAVAASDLVVFATPTYKATYTGLLKAFLDRYATNGLSGVVAIPVQTGGNVAHSLAVNGTLVPLLLELGAIVPGRGLYVPMDREDDIPALVELAAAEYSSNLRHLVRIAGSAVEQ